MHTKLLVLGLFFLLLAGAVSAAFIHGTIYDISLNKVSNARVEIDTVPKQHYVALNGTYSFNVPVGDYSIKAAKITGSAIQLIEDNISIKDDGSYVVDMILFPSFEEEKELLKETGISIDSGKSSKINIYLLLILFLACAVFLGVFFAYRSVSKRPKDRDNQPRKTEEVSRRSDTDEVIAIIKQEGGRTTQKDIRKRIPLSEAKISLMIAELESDGIIKKIKKGRGNILILNR